MNKIEALENIKARCLDCRACPLWETRTNVVFGRGAENAVIGETLWSSSLCCALQMERGIGCHVLDPLEEEFAFSCEGDIAVPDENAVEKAFEGLSAVYGDPLYQPLCRGNTVFVSVPHEAFSGRCFRKSMRSLCGQNFEKGI
jgi:hypothetical protein